MMKNQGSFWSSRRERFFQSSDESRNEGRDVTCTEGKRRSHFEDVLVRSAHPDEHVTLSHT